MSQTVIFPQFYMNQGNLRVTYGDDSVLHIQTVAAGVVAPTYEDDNAWTDLVTVDNSGNVTVTGSVTSDGLSGGALTGTSLDITGTDVNLALTTGTAAPSAGGGDALPATPAGYATIKIGGTSHQIAYY